MRDVFHIGGKAEYRVGTKFRENYDRQMLYLNLCYKFVVLNFTVATVRSQYCPA